MKRIFIVGSPRSGTTLIQTLLMTSGQLQSFPETFLFSILCPKKTVKGLIGWRKKLKKNIAIWNESAQVPVPHNIYRHLFSRSAAKDIVSSFDKHFAAQGFSGWIEKTPQHLRYIDDITKLAHGALFVHVIRDMNANIHSLNQVDGQWKGTRTVKDNALRVLNDRALHVKYAHQDNHFFISYDNLLTATSKEIERLEAFTGIKIPTDYETKLSAAAEQVCLPSEQWKANNFSQSILKSHLNRPKKDADDETRFWRDLLS